MNLQFLQTVVQAIPKINKVSALAWSPDNVKLSVVSADRIVSLYDDSGTRREKFPTKSSDPNQRNYSVRALAFSPDSTRLAVAQSDNMVFIYKIGCQWGEKKTICNKFAVTSPVTTVVWGARQDDVLIGLADGKVRIGHLRSNKSETLYQYASYVLGMSTSPDRNRVAVAHADGTVILVSLISGNLHKEKLVQHPCAPTALAFGEMVMAAGNDQAVVFYNERGQAQQRFDYSNVENEKEYTAAASSPSGQSVVVATFNRLRVFSYSLQRQQWEEAAVIEVPNMYVAACLAFKRDGSKLAVGTLAGAVEVYAASIKTVRYKGKFEFTYVSAGQVIVKRLSNGTTCMLQTGRPLEITKINVYQDNYVVAYTSETLICADHAHALVSEIPWPGPGNEKFIFENPKTLMVFSSGELTLVQYGAAKNPLASIRTQFVNEHLISVRLGERKVTLDDGQVVTEENKKIGYLMDLQTIRVEDLTNGSVIATITHERKIDWLELDRTATKLLFRDKRHILHMFDTATQAKVTLLNFCSYVQWVPESDVVVAQNRGNLCVWYNIGAPERVTLIPINGDVIDIVREGGKTEVIVDNGAGQDRVQLNEGLIAFAPAISERQLAKACDILEAMSLTPETEGMWHTLAQMALEDRALLIAERCYAAVSDIARTAYLHPVNKMVEQAGEIGVDHYAVRVQLDCLEKQFKKAEYTLINQGLHDEAIDMYTKIFKFEEAIAVADMKQDKSDANARRLGYYQWLVESGQEERAAALKESEGDILEAVQLLLRGGLPARAAQLITDHNVTDDQNLLLQVAEGLLKSGLYEKAGEFFQKMQMNEPALDAYKKGRAYRPAVELARTAFPERVVQLEEEWADWLVAQRQLEAATHHYVECGKYLRAIDVALEGRLWTTAVQLADRLGPDDQHKYFRLIAQHYEEVFNFELAEEYFKRGDSAREAVDMYLRHNMWERANALASTFMNEQEVCKLCINQATRLESQGRLQEAEKLLVTAGELDLAINMYRKARKFDDMIRLVSAYRRDLLSDTHNALAEQLDNEGHLREAEAHYVAGGRWKSAVNMYRANEMWDDAMRVARQFGGAKSAGQVCMVHAKSMGGDAGVNLLMKHGFVDLAITLALDNELYTKAEQIARESSKARLPDVFLKHAVALEDAEQFAEAEVEFLRAGNPREAVLMYTHQHDWLNATRVAESYCPDAVVDILVAQGTAAEEQKDLARAEGFFIRAKKPELAVFMYERANRRADADRITSEYKLNTGADDSKQIGGAGGDSSKDVLSGPGAAQQRAINEFIRGIEKDAANAARAVKFAKENLPSALEDTISKVGEKLIALKRHGTLASILADIGQVPRAIDVYCQGGLYADARQLAEVKAPDRMRQIAAAQLEKCAAERDWATCIEVAKNESPELLAEYAGYQAGALIDEGQLAGACQVFIDNGVVPIPKNIPVYKRLAQEILDAPEAGEGASREAMPMLREVLFGVVRDLASQGVSEEFNPQAVEDFEKLAFIVHLFSEFYALGDAGLKEQRARAAVSLLRYYGAIPADKAYYLAGTACRDVDWPMSFVFFNRYLDITEAMEESDGDTEGEMSVIENTGFENTDIPEELTVQAGAHQYLDQTKREEVKSTLLQAISSGAVEAGARGLATRTCEECGADIYEATLWCHSCKTQNPPCIVTGYPVLKATKVQCKACGRAANKDDWNKFVLATKVCPWCGEGQNPIW